MTLVNVYLSLVVPLIFLIMAIEGEGRGVVASFAFGMSSAMVVFLVTGFIDEALIALDYQLTLLIPALEEFVKTLPLVFFFVRSKAKGKYFIVRYALAVGIGFSIIENHLYLSMAEAASPTVTALVVMRSLTASLLHGSTTAMAGYCYQAMRAQGAFSAALALGVYLASVSTHSLYNALLVSSRYSFIAFILPIAAFAFVAYCLNGFGFIASPRRGREGMRS